MIISVDNESILLFPLYRALAIPLCHFPGNPSSHIKNSGKGWYPPHRCTFAIMSTAYLLPNVSDDDIVEFSADVDVDARSGGREIIYVDSDDECDNTLVQDTAQSDAAGLDAAGPDAAGPDAAGAITEIEFADQEEIQIIEAPNDLLVRSVLHAMYQIY